MKKTFIFAIVLAGLTLCGCEPVIDDQAMGDVLTTEQLDIDVTNITEGSNAIVLKNNTPRTGAYWDTGIGVSTRQCDTIVMPYVGDIEIKFTGICDGGQVTTSRNVHITRIDHPIRRSGHSSPEAARRVRHGHGTSTAQEEPCMAPPDGSPRTPLHGT